MPREIPAAPPPCPAGALPAAAAWGLRASHTLARRWRAHLRGLILPLPHSPPTPPIDSTAGCSRTSPQPPQEEPPLPKHPSAAGEAGAAQPPGRAGCC
jgi:hypothetical protein